MQVTDEMLAAYKMAHRAAVDAALNDYGKIATIADDARRAGIKAALTTALSDKQAGEVKDSAAADQYWSTVEQLANCEDEISRLRALLSRAEEYVIDGVTTAKIEAEMNAPYPARAPRYDAALAEVRQLYADIQAALAATRSGSAIKPNGGRDDD